MALHFCWIVENRIGFVKIASTCVALVISQGFVDGMTQSTYHKGFSLGFDTVDWDSFLLVRCPVPGVFGRWFNAVVELPNKVSGRRLEQSLVAVHNILLESVLAEIPLNWSVSQQAVSGAATIVSNDCMIAYSRI
jgi:hypothetical protein